MPSQEFVKDFEQTPLSQGDEVVAVLNGHLIRGRVLQPRMDGIYGACLIQSLIDPQRTAIIVPSCCVVIKKAQS